MPRPGRPYYRSIVATFALVAAGTLANRVVGQHYDEIKPPIDAKQASALTGRVSMILRDATALNAEDKKVLDDYFTRHIFPSMTLLDPVELGQLQTRRDWLFTRYLNVAKSQVARDYVMGNTLKAMGAISKGNFHPASRYNAVLIMGQLEGEQGKPLPGATEALLSLLQNDTFDYRGKPVEVPTAVKLGALVGLQRHVAKGVAEKYADQITQAALAVATREKSPDDVSDKVYGWVRRQAAQVLAQQFAAGLTPQVHQAFVQIISDDSNHLDDRCSTAELLTAKMYEGKQLDGQAMAQALGKLARDVFAYESEQADDYIDEVTGSGGFAPGGGFGGGFGGEMGGYGGRGGFGGEMGGYGGRGGEMGGYGGRGGEMGGYGGEMSFGGGVGMVEDTGPKYEKRRMMDRAKAIVSAARAVAAGSSDELKGRLEQFAGMINTVLQNAAEATEIAVADSVSKLSRDINQMVSNWTPAAAPAGGADEEGFESPADESAAADAPAVEAAG